MLNIWVRGNKEGAGNPAALYNATGEKFVYVAPNYRLGAFGWLAPKGQDWDSNIGLHDARAASDWVKNHISKFGGNPKSVTAMGLSAGAGLIANLLVSRGPPLGFQRVSPPSNLWNVLSEC